MSNQDPHRIHWFEIPVSNLEKAVALYTTTLGVEVKREVLFGVPQAIFVRDGEGVSGSLICDPQRAPRRGTGTVVYLAAKDGVAASLARALAGGAKLVQPATDISPFGEIALFEDPDGNVVGLHAER